MDMFGNMKISRLGNVKNYPVPLVVSIELKTIASR